MDIGEVENFTAQFDAHARTLSTVAGLLGGLVEQLRRRWLGPAIDAFYQDFETSHRPALLAAAQALTDMHTRLTANINQQLAASAATGLDSTSGWTAARVADDAWHGFMAGLTGVGLLSIPATAINELGKHADPLPEDFSLAKDLSTFDKDHTFSDYSDSPVLTWLHDTPEVAKADQLLYESHAYTVLDKVGVVGMGVGLAYTAVDVVRTGAALSQGHYAAAANDAVDAASDGLKSSPNLVLFGAGVDLTLLHEVVNLDWKDTPSPFTGDNFKQDYVPVIESMGTGAYWRQAGKVLLNAM